MGASRSLGLVGAALVAPSGLAPWPRATAGAAPGLDGAGQAIASRTALRGACPALAEAIELARRAGHPPLP